MIGLTIDYDSKLVFWIVRSYKDSTLLSGKLLELYEPESIVKNRTESSVQLPDKNLTGPLAYYSDRLLWITDDRTLTIANESGQNLAYIRNDKVSGIKSVTVIDPTKASFPAENDLVVLPDQVRNDTIKAVGKWDRFNVSWHPVTNVNYGVVNYEITISVGGTKIFKDVEVNYYEFLSNTPDPYSIMDITIRAFTHWGYSLSSRTSIHSPAALPIAPHDPRVFVSHKMNPFNKGLNIFATVRWRAPLKPNGEIIGYRVTCVWEEGGKQNRREEMTTAMQYVFQMLLPETSYSFRIAAQTIMGQGNYTEAISINTRQDMPIPQVIAATEDGILLVDLDLQSSAVLTHLESPVTCITFMQLTDKIYWFDMNNELFSYNNRTKAKITAVSSKVLAVTIDWVEQVLYWSQTETNGTAIYALNLDRFAQEKSSPRKLLYRNANITDLKVSPMDRIIFWNEVNGDISIISYYHIDKQTAETFNVFEHPCFNKTLKMQRKIVNRNGNNKPNGFHDFWQLVSLDISIGEPRVLLGADFVSTPSVFYSVGLSSKTCHQYDFNYKSSMSSLVKDSDKFYWFDANTINAKNIISRNFYSYTIDNVHHLIAFHQQNYPKIDCLVPLQRQPPSHQVKLLSQYTRSLHLILPEPQMDSRCNITAVGVRYKIMYKPYRVGDHMTCELDNCTKIHSFDDSVVINELKPFTKYLFQVGLNNYYGEKIGIETQLGPAIILATAPGEPSEPRNLTAEAISMTEAIVHWYPPIEFNSDAVWYEVHWQTESALNKLKNKQQQLVQGM